MSDENDKSVAGPDGPPASSQSPPPAAEQRPAVSAEPAASTAPAPPTGPMPSTEPTASAVPGVSRRERLRRTAGRRSVQLLAAGVIGGIVGGGVVGALGALSGHDHHPSRVAQFQRDQGPAMRWGVPPRRYRGGAGGSLPGGRGRYVPGPGKVPGQGRLPLAPVPQTPPQASPAPSATPS